jgi:thioredoxin 1
MIVSLTQSTYDQVVENSDKLVLLDAWAPWCAPCRAMEPMIQDLETTHGDNLVIAKLNVDEESELASQLDVSGLPTLRLLRRGQLAFEAIGLPDQARVTAAVEGALA